MINKSKSFLFPLLFLLFFVTAAEAQVRLKSFNLEGGYYLPSHDYWKETSVISLWDNVDDIGSGLYGGVSLEVHLVNPVSLRLGLGYWTKTLDQQLVTLGITRDAEISLQYLPINFDVLVNISIEELGDIEPYVGIGFGLNLINVEYTRTPEASATDKFDLDAKDYFGKLLAGISIPISTQVGFGLEFRYLFGKYVAETYTTAGTIQDYDASFGGPQIIGMIKILFRE